MKRPCPICGKPAQWEDNPDRPFCSERCRLLDLGAWVDERYVMEGDIADDEGASSSIVDGQAE